MEPKESISNRPAGRFENHKLVSLEKLSGLTTRRVKVDMIYHFDQIPDSNEPSRFDVPVLVETVDEFACVDNYYMVENSVEEMVSAIVFKILDTSDVGIGLFKTMLKMAGLGGKLNFAEQVRNVRILFDMYHNQNGIIASSSGGDRRSGSFKGKEGLKIQKFLADHLDKSEGTIQKYLEHSAYLSTETLLELGKQGATKRHFAYLSSRRTDFLKGVDPGWSAEQIEQEVSKRVISDWLPEYVPKKDKKAAISEQTVPPESGALSETVTPSGDEIGMIEDLEEESSEGLLEAAEPDDLVAATGDEDDEDLPDIKSVFPHLDRKSSVKAKLPRVIELGNDMIRMGKEEPDPEKFSTEIERIIAELMKLLRDSKASANPNTLAVVNG